MSHPARKLNFMIRTDIAEALEMLVPSGKRSSIVNSALEKELNHLRKQKNTEHLLRMRSNAPKVSAEEIAETLRSDRSR